MVSISIRDVMAVCPIAANRGSSALRDAALEAAAKAAPPGSTRDELAQLAAALILVGVDVDPSDHGLSLDSETLARASVARQAAARAQATPADQLAALERELDHAADEIRRADDALAVARNENCDLRDRIVALEAEIAAARVPPASAAADAPAESPSAPSTTPAKPTAKPPKP